MVLTDKAAIVTAAAGGVGSYRVGLVHGTGDTDRAR
jgi:hypothetical protein